MNEQGHAQLGHGFEDGIEHREVPDPSIGVGGGPGGVKLHRGDKARFPTLAQIRGLGGFRQVEGHERLEGLARGHRRQDGVSVARRVFAASHRGHQVRHHDGAAKLSARGSRHGGEHGAVAKVQVPIVRGA